MATLASAMPGTCHRHHDVYIMTRPWSYQAADACSRVSQVHTLSSTSCKHYRRRHVPAFPVRPFTHSVSSAALCCTQGQSTEVAVRPHNRVLRRLLQANCCMTAAAGSLTKRTLTCHTPEPGHHQLILLAVSRGVVGCKQNTGQQEPPPAHHASCVAYIPLGMPPELCAVHSPHKTELPGGRQQAAAVPWEAMLYMAAIHALKCLH
jgi:hypothetical protein